MDLYIILLGCVFIFSWRSRGLDTFQALFSNLISFHAKIVGLMIKTVELGFRAVQSLGSLLPFT